MLLLLLACAAPDGAPGSFEAVPDRAVGDHTPALTGCDPLDAARCWLPFPSFTATRADPQSPTGLRVEVADEELPNGDDPRWLELADGFSRLSPALTTLDGAVDIPSLEGAIRLFDAGTGVEWPVWSEAIVEGSRTLVIAYPDAVLPPGAEIVVAVTDAVTVDGGAPAARERLDEVALGLVDPSSADEEALRAFHAPVRATLDAAGLAPETVVRAWSFPTRTADDVGRRLRAMFADVDAAELSVTIDRVEARSGAIALVVYGTVDGVPMYRPDDEEWLNLDDDGLPVALGTTSAPFRVVVPAGEGDYVAVIYGHGTGGDVTDGTFDDHIAGAGIAKVGMEFHGWNGDELVNAITYFSHVFDATSRSTSALLQSLADAHAIVRALQGPLADALAADTLGGAANPAAGRRPLAERPMWVGGSLGGTMGAVMVAASDVIDTGVLNVPAAAWSHLVPRASLYTLLVDPITRAWYPNDIDRHAAIAMSQNAWDDVDGAAWDDPGSVLLLQESIGDPVVPNLGTAMLARARGAAVVGAPLDGMLDGLEQTDGVTGRTGITQYLTPYTDEYDIHGFAGKSGESGDAAREQIDAFAQGWRDGQAPSVVLPSQCAPTGACDFGD